MKRYFFVITAVLLTYYNSIAQSPDEILNRWSASSPIEKIYLHLDRDNYMSGETAWFKAYLYSDYQPDTISTSLYVELLDESSVLLSRKILPILLGSTNGQIELADSLVTGAYLIKAYTPTMLNHDPGFIYKRSIFIYGKKKGSVSEAKPPERKTRMEFFPEGGNLVNGFTNTVAFKATDENGMPVEVSGSLKNEKNESIVSFSSYHDGMGMFDFAPVEKERYYVVLDGNAPAEKFYLPDQPGKGIAVTLMPHPQGNYFELKQGGSDPDFRAAYMIGQMQHHVVFRQNFNQAKDELQGVINTEKLLSGILQVTFFNQKGMPLAERLCFVNNKEYIQHAELVADTINFSPKEKNRLSIVMKDTVQGSLSVSVIDPEYNLLPSREENIVSRFLLTADLKGYIHNPAWYFAADNDSIKTGLDLVMMTNGWRRFKWTDLLSKNQQAVPALKDGKYITLSGRVNLRDIKKPFADRDLLILILAADSTRSMQMVRTDKQGNFRLDSLLFFGNTRLLFSDIRGKKNQYIDVFLSGDSITRVFALPAATHADFLVSELMPAGKQTKFDQDYDAIMRASGIMLEGVTVKVRKKSPVQELEEKYASGMFAGSSERTIDLVNSTEVVYQNNIFDYLQSKVPGLSIANEGLDYFVYYRQMATASAMGIIPMTLYLDEVETDASFISTIPANQIAMVKVFSSFVGATGNAAGGVLAIYTKKGSDMSDIMSSAADLVRYRGYSVIKEFYAPDYSVSKATGGKPDQRITLDWRPNIFVNGINPSISFSFYNNERTKQYKVVVEGMTVSGKMIFIEKTISQPLRSF
jgi:hypothetical protein